MVSLESVKGRPGEHKTAVAFRRAGVIKVPETVDAQAEGIQLPIGATPGLSLLDVVPKGPVELRGQVEFYGHNPSAKCWIFAGRVSGSWEPTEIASITAEFRGRAETGRAVVGFYDLADGSEQDVGVIICLPDTSKKRQPARAGLSAICAETAYLSLRLEGAGDRPVAGDALTTVLRPILPRLWPQTRLDELLPLLPSILDVATDEVEVEGCVELHAYDPSQKGWIFLGWVSRPWSNADRPVAVARFSDHEHKGKISAVFFELPDLGEDARACMLFMPDAAETAPIKAAILSVEVQIGSSVLKLEGERRQPAGLQRLTAAIAPYLGDAGVRTQAERLWPRLRQELAAAPQKTFFEGHVDFFGYHTGAEGWVFCGWVSTAWTDHPPVVTARFAEGNVGGAARTIFYKRPDILGRGVGMVLMLPGIEGRNHLLSLELSFGDFTVHINTDRRAPHEAAMLSYLCSQILLDHELLHDTTDLNDLLVADEVATIAGDKAEYATVRSLSGHIDFYGYLPESQIWLFCGWIAQPWREEAEPIKATAYFEDGAISGKLTTVNFYHRADAAGRGVGVVLTLGSPAGDRHNLLRLHIEVDQSPTVLRTSGGCQVVQRAELTNRLTSLLADHEADADRAPLWKLLFPEALRGFIDFYGYHAVAGGWFLCGWMSSDTQDKFGTGTFTIEFERGEISGRGLATYYHREDLDGRGRGTVLFMPGSDAQIGALSSLLVAKDETAKIHPAGNAQRLSETELISGLEPIIARAEAGSQRDMLLALLKRRSFTGADTVGELTDRVFLELDEAILCGPNSLVLIGWYLAKPQAIRSLRLRCGTLVSPIAMEAGVRIERPDVLAAVGQQHGFDDGRCGFMVFLPNALEGSCIPYIEIETARGEIGYRVLPPPKLHGLPAMKRLLGCFDVRFLDVPKVYDRVIGPAVALLNEDRLTTRPDISIMEFGASPADPEFTVIVPLHGRIDFVEYQFALFSAHPSSRRFEFIYVLDDPSRRREAQFLFASVYQRFQIPFRALLFDRNVGFAPANNIGLEHARGKYVCFLNSDAFPGTPDWLERLAASLEADPELGAVGPLLLYEDGSVQHQGMAFRPLDEFGGWYFGHHPGKGLQPGSLGGIRKCVSITGACMVMRRSLAERLNGFDEAYAIGDFEDSDLCLRIDQMGLACAVDLDVHLYHLERKSQSGSESNLRMNLTLHNAWFHQRRWAETISTHPLAFDLESPTTERTP